jgi:hypothetical protein
MKKLDILEKALDKAMKKNYKSPFDFIYEKGKLIEGKNYYAIIFDKDFCKAIWSEEKTFLPFGPLSKLGEDVILWKWHLKNMVVSDNPINYLEENIELDSWDKIYGKEALEKLEQYKEKLANLIGNISEADVSFFSTEWVRKNILAIK